MFSLHPQVGRDGRELPVTRFSLTAVPVAFNNLTQVTFFNLVSLER